MKEDFEQGLQSLNVLIGLALELAALMEVLLAGLRLGCFTNGLYDWQQEVTLLSQKADELSQRVTAYLDTAIENWPLVKGIELRTKVNYFLEQVGEESPVRTKYFYIGQKAQKFEAAIVFVDNLADRDLINKNILQPLMLQMRERIPQDDNMAEYLSKRCIISSGTMVEINAQKAVEAVKSGQTVLILEKMSEAIVIETAGGTTRQVSEPVNEAVIKGSREGFVENLNVNISMVRRLVKDKNFAVENFICGKRSQTKVAMLYIKDTADETILNKLRVRIQSIQTDMILSVSILFQLIEKKMSIFPLAFYTERVDRVAANISEGKVAVMIDGSPTAFTVPAVFWEFFHTVEDYFDNFIVASTIRLLRLTAAAIVLFLPSLYLTLVKFNGELIPTDFIMPIVKSRTGMPLSPFIEIVTLEFLIELLREGGLRLPTKIAQTISIVGGIIIGDAIVESRIVSPTTLLVVGITNVASFLIPAYEMSIAIRFIRILVLLLADYMGLFGIAVSIIILVLHLLSIQTFGVPYFTMNKDDVKDTVIRAPIRDMKQQSDILKTHECMKQD